MPSLPHFWKNSTRIGEGAVLKGKHESDIVKSAGKLSIERKCPIFGQISQSGFSAGVLGGQNLERTYDVFERFPDGTVRWRTSVVGHEAAIVKLKEIAVSSTNEFQLMHLPTQTIIATINEPKPS
jgi:hypothetical protein